MLYLKDTKNNIPLVPLKEVNLLKAENKNSFTHLRQFIFGRIKNKDVEKITYPTLDNMLDSLEYQQATLSRFKNACDKATILCSKKMIQVIENIVGLNHRKLDLDKSLNHLIRHRPLMFMRSDDSYLLPQKLLHNKIFITHNIGSGGTGLLDNSNVVSKVIETINDIPERNNIDNNIKSRNEMVKSGALLTYSEIAAAATLSFGGPVYIFNKGKRGNVGRVEKSDNYAKRAYYVGCVGARFERVNTMEHMFVLVTKNQNTKENGYGGDDPSTNRPATVNNAQWKSLLNDGNDFPTYDTVKKISENDRNKRYYTSNTPPPLIYFDKMIYKKRMTCTIRPFLKYANNVTQNKDSEGVYVHMVALGCGAWSPKQFNTIYLESIIVDIVEEVLADLKSKCNITDVDFSFFELINHNKKLKEHKRNTNYIKSGVNMQFLEIIHSI